MDRRDISRGIFAAAVGSAFLEKAAVAQTCTAPCFAITQAETDAGVPTSTINTAIPPYRADRYGFSNASTATGTANAMALGWAVKAATAAGARLKIPGSVAATHGSTTIYGTPFPYVATSVLELTCDVEGDGAAGTVILCSTTKPNNFPYFRLTGDKEIRDLFIKNGGAISDLTIGLHISNSAVSCNNNVPPQCGALAATGYMRVTRVIVANFNTNIQVERSFIVTFDQVQATGGNYGFYCQPDTTAPTDSGSANITTHLHLNCYYLSNVVNVFYQTPIASYNVTFVNGANQNATAPYGANGSSYANYFGGISNLHFIDWYSENQPAATVIANGGGTVTFDGAWLSNTGGIYLGSGAYGRFINIRTATAAGLTTDNLAAAAGGTQNVTMEGCIWPKAPAAASLAHCILMQTTINGTFTPFSYS